MINNYFKYNYFFFFFFFNEIECKKERIRMMQPLCISKDPCITEEKEKLIRWEGGGVGFCEPGFWRFEEIISARKDGGSSNSISMCFSENPNCISEFSLVFRKSQFNFRKPQLNSQLKIRKSQIYFISLNSIFHENVKVMSRIFWNTTDIFLKFNWKFFKTSGIF